MARWTGLEPATPCVTGRYSNQLNYHRKNNAFSFTPRGTFIPFVTYTQVRSSFHKEPASIKQKIKSFSSCNKNKRNFKYRVFLNKLCLRF